MKVRIVTNLARKVNIHHFFYQDVVLVLAQFGVYDITLQVFETMSSYSYIANQIHVQSQVVMIIVNYSTYFLHI